jgi:biotin operon repressor
MKTPKDPYILLSFINTKLRDEYHSLEDLCKSLSIDRTELEKILSSIEYKYTGEANRFTPIL